MNNKRYFKILGIIEDIELTNKLIFDLKKVNKETNEILGFSSILRKKRNLTKDLLSEMIDADISFNQFEKYYLKVITYLKKGEKTKESSKEVLEIFNKMDQILTTP